MLIDFGFADVSILADDLKFLSARGSQSQRAPPPVDACHTSDQHACRVVRVDEPLRLLGAHGHGLPHLEDGPQGGGHGAKGVPSHSGGIGPTSSE